MPRIIYIYPTGPKKLKTKKTSNRIFLVKKATDYMKLIGCGSITHNKLKPYKNLAQRMFV